MDLRNQVGRLSGGSDGEAVEEPSAEDLTGALVVWKLATATPFYASVRYRCLFPLIGLSELGVQPLVLSDRETISDFGRVRALILVKTFTDHDVELARRATAAGVPLFIDLCDNIFIDEYGGERGHQVRQNFETIAADAAAVVTTGPGMAEVIRPNVPAGMPIEIVHDQVETHDLTLAVVEDEWWREDPFGLRVRPRQSFKTAARRLLGAIRWRARIPLKLARGIGFVAGTLVHEVASRREGFRVTLTRIAGSGAFRAGCLSLFFRLPGSLRDSLFGRVLRDPIAPLRTRDFARYFAPEEARRLGLVTNTETDFRRTIVWFGHHGSGHGRYGMSTVADLVPILEKVNVAVPIRLLIVSDNEQKFRALFADVPFAAEFRRWHPLTVFDDIGEADVCIVPNSRDKFSLPKSANRVVMALSLGVPVVATDVPSMAPLKDCIVLDDWEAGLKRYLLDDAFRSDHLARARTILDNQYSCRSVAETWLRLIRRVAAYEQPAQLVNV